MNDKDIENLPFRQEVSVYVMNNNKEFIAVFSALPGRFCKAPAGGVEAGETTEEAAIREIKEELGIDIKIIAKSRDNYQWLHTKERIIEKKLNYKGSSGTTYIAKMNPSDQKITLQDEEVKGYVWLSKEDIYKFYSTSNQIETAEKLFEEFKEYF